MVHRVVVVAPGLLLHLRAVAPLVVARRVDQRLSNAVQRSKIDWSYAFVHGSLPEWMSPTCTTSWMLLSALIVSMNAGVAWNSACGRAAKAGSRYGASP
jgi:hypothetical protein